MDILSFALAILFYIWIASAAFWGIATAAYVSWSSLKSVPLWALIGALAPIVGLFAAIIADIVTRNRNKSSYPNYPGSATASSQQIDSSW